MLVDTLDEAEKWIAEGVKLIAYASDVAILRGGYAAAADRLHGSAARGPMGKPPSMHAPRGGQFSDVAILRAGYAAAADRLHGSAAGVPTG